MSSRSFAAAAATILVSCAAAAADDKTAPAAAGPAAELAVLEFLHGAFTCTGTWHSDAGPVKKHSTIKTRWALGKHFLTFDYEQPGSKEQPRAISAIGYFGWDAGSKKFVHNAINNQGLSVTLYAAAGGDALAFTGEGSAASGAAPRLPVSFTFKKAEKGFTVTNTLQRDGKPVVLSEETCTK